MQKEILSKSIALLAFFTLAFQYAHSQSSDQLYNQVQNIYINASNTDASNCSQIKNFIAQLSGYKGYRQAVPASKAYSVNFPNKVNNPGIGDLAKDRIARLESRFKRCFTASADPRSVQLYNQVQNLYGRYYSISSTNCNAVRQLINELNAYKNNTTPVPPDKAYSVNFKGRVTNPTIGDLAEDRIARVESRFKGCVNAANDPGLQLYDEVQNIYLTAPRKQFISSSDCARINAVITKLGRYQNNSALVPSKWVYTIMYPAKKANPTIADLARDRMARLTQLRSSCDKIPQMSNYVLTNLPGIYNYNHKGRKYQLSITRQNNNLSAAFTSHEYSYPPIYQGAELIVNNVVRFKFSLGGTYTVNLEVAHNRMGVSAYISESWEGNTKVNLGVLSSNSINPPGEQSTDGKVNITFFNKTNANAVVYWVNFQGVEVKYYDLQPGRSYVQSTFNTHKWVVRQRGRILVNYVATNYKNQSVYIK
jgi:hypothetical protein